MRFGHLVKDFGVVAQGLKTVCTTFRDIEHFPILLCKLDSKMLSKPWRLRPEIDDDIVDRTPIAAHHLNFFARRRLIVHSPKRSFEAAKRDAALRDVRV